MLDERPLFVAGPRASQQFWRTQRPVQEVPEDRPCAGKAPARVLAVISRARIEPSRCKRDPYDTRTTCYFDHELKLLSVGYRIGGALRCVDILSVD